MENRPTGVRGMGCNCGGYHFTHRKGSPWCRENPLAPLYHADRQGDPPAVLLEIAARIVKDSPDLAGRVEELCELWRLKDNHGSEIV